MELVTTKKASDLIALALEELGIEHAFGIIGAGNVHLFEAISRRGFTEIICVHHEQAACMAVQTYYRINRKLSCALLTTGAGATNGVTGVLSAWADSIPCLIIAGNENSRFTNPDNPLRMWGVQGYDSVEMVRRITKHAERVVDPKLVVRELKKACYIALKDRPGPCWIEIPMDIQSAVIKDSDSVVFAPTAAESTKPNRTIEFDAQIKSVTKALSHAQRPVLWLGHGIRLSNAENLIIPLLDQLQIPALISWAGIDMVDSSHPLLFGRAGVYGQRASNFILQNSDYVLAIGTRLAIPQIGYDLKELARSARIDVVDIDENEAKKHSSRVKEMIVCDAGVFIRALNAQLAEICSGLTEQWIKQCQDYKNLFPVVGSEHHDCDGFLNSYRFMQKLNQYFKPDQVIVTDMGTALLSGHQVLEIMQGQRLLTSTGLGEMGYGLPGAIGASFARDRGEVMCLNCDGGMMMNLQELQTIVHHRLPIKLFIFNNDGYLMIKHTQKALFKSGYIGTNKSSGISCPDFSKLADAFGIKSFQIRTADDCEQFIPQIQSMDGPVICEVFMHPEQSLVPKLSLVAKSDGTLVSPPLEDLSPLLPRHVLKDAMIIGMHEKSNALLADKLFAD